MMNFSNYLKKNAEPATDFQVLEFERKYKIPLPEQVKDILYFSNGCAAINRYIKIDEITFEYLTRFFSIEEIDYAIQNIRCIEDEFHYYFSDVLLPIGDPGGARYLCIGIKGEYKNKTYIIHYQDYDYQNLNSMLTYVAPSIENILEKLVPDMPE